MKTPISPPNSELPTSQPSSPQGQTPQGQGPEILQLRDAAPAQDDDGFPIGPLIGVDPTRPVGPRNPPRYSRKRRSPPRPTCSEIERRIAEAQLWISQRLPQLLLIEKARESWGVTNTQTLNRYLDIARERMVQDLISDRRRHVSEQIYALNECARRAIECEQFSAAVGAFRVIGEIGGMLRAPLKPPDSQRPEART
jgi:hypothetical protein